MTTPLTEPATPSDKPADAEGDYRYAAFISYRHTPPDRKWAKWLHRALETYRVPGRLRRTKSIPARLGPIFRDEEELPASSDLGAELDTALRRSRFLIVICSPRTPASRWVNQEVLRFREMGRHDRILALLIEGEPAESFPPALVEIRRTVTAADGMPREQLEHVEPLAADVRSTREERQGHLGRMARLRLLACILGVSFDDLRQREHERRVRRVAGSGVVLTILLAVLAGLVAFALRQGRLVEASRYESRRARLGLDDLPPLRGVSDATALSAVVEGRKISFTVTGHPQFGQSLIPRTGPVTRLIDPTPLKYNHATHIKVSPETADCATCHQCFSPGETPGQRTDRRYMQPVNYQGHCAPCHGIEFIKGSGFTVPHDSLDAIRPLLAPYADLEAGFLRQINEMPEEQRHKELGSGGPRISGRKKEAKKPEVWAKEKADEVRRKVMALFTKGYTPPGLGAVSDTILKANAENKAQLDAGENPPPLQVPDALTALMNANGFPENFLGHDQQTGCSYCHVMSDASPPGARHGTAGDLLMKLAGPPMAPSVVASLHSRGSAPEVAPSTQPYTLPTGLTHAPRRWFVNSSFNHDAHRMKGATCVQCHRGVSGDNASVIGNVAAVEVPAENDPDAADPMLRQFGQTTGRILMPTVEDCVSCHREGGKASAACGTCHNVVPTPSGK